MTDLMKDILPVSRSSSDRTQRMTGSVITVDGDGVGRDRRFAHRQFKSRRLMAHRNRLEPGQSYFEHTPLIIPPSFLLSASLR